MHYQLKSIEASMFLFPKWTTKPHKAALGRNSRSLLPQTKKTGTLLFTTLLSTFHSATFPGGPKKNTRTRTQTQTHTLYPEQEDSPLFALRRLFVWCYCSLRFRRRFRSTRRVSVNMDIRCWECGEREHPSWWNHNKKLLVVISGGRENNVENAVRR